MSDLQSFDFDKSQYERVNQKWMCGHQREGNPCPLGPDGRGRCQATADCKPHKNGDRWECSRSLLQGGKCEHGPRSDGTCYHQITPCRPLRSLRARRAFFVTGLVLFSVALVAMFSFTPLRDRLISPGPLTAKHSAKAQACDTCHADETKSPLSWIQLAVAGGEKTAPSACVRCHKVSVPATADKPHNLTGEQLQAITAGMQKQVGDEAVRRFNIFSGAEQSLQCDSCHREHRGKHAALTDVPNKRCINCHTSQHADLDDHPAFTQFAYSRRTRINFNHTEHFEKHFKDEKVAKHAPDSCATCHALDDEYGIMVSRSFKDSCLRCHKDDTTGESFIEKGVAFFRLPYLDMETLNKHNISVGQWPDGLEFEDLTPMMLFLLSANENLRPLLKRIVDRELSLGELDGESTETLQQVGELVRTMKDIFLDMAHRSSRWLSLVEKLTDLRLDNTARATVENFLPVQDLNRAFSIWIPNLSIEKVLRNRDKHVENRFVPVDYDLLVTDVNTVRPGRWYRQGYALLYRPKGHDDEYLRTWIELAREAMAGGNDIAAELFNHLTHKETPGQCMRCHTVDNVDGQITINWKALHQPPKDRQFTVFTHIPHMKVLKQDECDTCHRLDENAEYKASYKDRNPFTFASNFKAVQKQTCIQCHNTAKVGDTCVTCHEYHRAQAFDSNQQPRVARRH